MPDQERNKQNSKIYDFFSNRKNRLKSSFFIGVWGFIGALFGTYVINMGEPGSLIETLKFASIFGIFFFIATFAFETIFSRLLHDNNPQSQRGKALRENLAAYGTISGSLIFVGIAFLLPLVTHVSPLTTFAPTQEAIAWGVGGTFPMVSLLIGLEKIQHPIVRAFRDKQIEFFAGLGFKYTPLRILLLSLGAGIGEELLFRGALQGWLALHLPIVLAILIPSVLFGLLHNVNRIYMLVAGIISIYLGVLFLMSGNILAPIISHTLYDIIAFAYINTHIKRNIHAPTH